MPQKRQCDYREAGAARQENIQAVWQPVPDGLKFYDQFRDPSRSTVFPPCAIIQPHAALFVNRNKKRHYVPHTCVPKITEKGLQMTYSQRILLSFLRRGITNLTIGSKRSVIQYPALATNP